MFWLLWVSRQKSMWLYCALFLLLLFPQVHSVQSVVTSLQNLSHRLCSGHLAHYLWSAQHKSIPSWCACCKPSKNFVNKQAAKDECVCVCVCVWSLLCAILPLSSSVPHLTSLYSSPPPTPHTSTTHRLHKRPYEDHLTGVILLLQGF